VKKQRKQDYFLPYTSRYSGGFDLLNSMKIPRPCAYKSSNLTAVEYYRGQNEMDYSISDNNGDVAYVVTLMDENSEFIYQNGEPATNVGRYQQDGYSVKIQTDEEDLVGIQKTLIRNCDSLNRLLEMNLYINVLSNTHPDFVSEITTTYSLSVGD